MKVYEHPDLKDVPLAAALHALADPCRIAIIRRMLEDEGRPVTCNEVPLTVSKATRSHHFEALREAGLIRTRVEGTKCLSHVRKAEFEKRFPGLLTLVLKEAEK